MKKQHWYLLFIALWASFIFYMSNQPASTSQASSDAVLHILENLFSCSIFTNEAVKNMVSFLVRKAAHMSEYALLAILCVQYLRCIGNNQRYMYAFLFALIYASSDEFHQLFIPGRSGEIKDIIIDAMGAMVGLAIHYILLKICIRKNRRR